VEESKGHAKIHAEGTSEHNFAITPNGELFCYFCSTEVTPTSYIEKEKMTALQKELREFLKKITLEEETNSSERMKVEELKDNSTPKSSIDKVNKQLYQELINKANKYPHMCGLNNLGNTCTCSI
jgi:uncharacterized Zn finger protein (UPF0148 family)